MRAAGRDDAERKQVTVLFADVEGSMDMAESQDPEQWRQIMQGFFSILADEVHRFQGTVDKFTGDGIMAIFGAPVAHEDHARRACYAALRMLDDTAEYAAELRRSHGLNFSARIGINSGEVVTGAIGGGEDGAYTAVGHTVGLAQRMEALAEPGKAYMTESAAELARGFLDLRDLGVFNIKGASRPIRVFELAGIGTARSRLDLSRQRGFSRFVGRDAEMGRLEEALAEARAGRGAAVGIVAEPGVGKSRLCHEFAEGVRAEGIEVFEAQAQPHGREIPFLPVLQMLRAYFGIADDDPERIAREKIAGRALLLNPDLAEELPVLFDFLGVPDPARPPPSLSAEARHRSLCSVVCGLVGAPNRREPAVAVIEDLHWLDSASEALLGELLGAVAGTQTLVLVNFRPEYESAWRPPASYRPLALEPLGPADTRDLLRDLAGEDASLDGFAELIHRRTEGNPFFIEEIVRELAESGVLAGERGDYRLRGPLDGLGVPASVQTVLAARIDRLDPAAKRLLQAASIAGKEVDARTLELIADPADAEAGEGIEARLRELIEASFLFELEVYPERVLAFRHPLTREVAYGSQLAERRALTHAAMARALIALNPERGDELAALIAGHLEAGREPREAARWAARAAYWTGSSQPREALALWARVTALSDGLEPDEEAVTLAVMSRLQQLDYAWRLGMDRGQAARLAREAEELATRSGDRRSLALLRMITAARPGLDHEADSWRAAAAETIRFAEESGDLHLRVALLGACSYAHLCCGDLDRFEAMLDELLALAGNDRRTGAGIVVGSPFAWATMGKAMVRRERAEFGQARRLFGEALGIAQDHGDPETASWTRSNVAILLGMEGEVEEAVGVARQNCELTERLGDVFSRVLAQSALGRMRTLAGEPEAGLELLEDAERLYRGAMGVGGEMQSWRAGMRAEALTALGRPAEGGALAAEAAALAEDRGMLWSLPQSLLALGRARAAEGRGREARAAFASALERSRASGHLAYMQAAEVELATLAPR